MTLVFQSLGIGMEEIEALSLHSYHQHVGSLSLSSAKLVGHFFSSHTLYLFISLYLSFSSFHPSHFFSSFLLFSLLFFSHHRSHHMPPYIPSLSPGPHFLHPLPPIAHPSRHHRFPILTSLFVGLGDKQVFILFYFFFFCFCFSLFLGLKL